LCVCFLMVALIASNPDKSEFVEFLIKKSSTINSKSEKSDDVFSKNIVAGLAGLVLETAVHERNYFIFSTYTLNLHVSRLFNIVNAGSPNIKFIGIAGQFIPLSNPLNNNVSYYFTPTQVLNKEASVGESFRAKLMTPQQIEKAQEMVQIRQKQEADEKQKRRDADARAVTAMGNEVAAYKAKIRAKILRNIVMSSDIPKDALAEFDVTLFSGGVVLNVKLVKSSGSAMYDRAVERAIKRSDPLPVPPEGLLSNQFRELRLNFSPNE
ncbi:MAG: TonB family protein, partial [Candidatus Nitrotoga sp.]|nr:TonB family protein [Candidatus Nitrotoga sp.]